MNVVRRDALTEPYRHPYRFWLPEVWRRTHCTPLAVAAVLCLAGGGALEQSSSSTSGWLGLGIFLALLGAIAVVQAMVSGAWHIWRVTRTWRGGGELERVRRARPHAGARDPDLAHDEFAVTVEETGHLAVWRFRPLEVYDEVPDGEVLVPGRPRHAAAIVSEVGFHPHDTAVAAAQLAEAQDAAAEFERRARDRAARIAAADADVDGDRRSVAAALQHLTGQARR